MSFLACKVALISVILKGDNEIWKVGFLQQKQVSEPRGSCITKVEPQSLNTE